MLRYLRNIQKTIKLHKYHSVAYNLNRNINSFNDVNIMKSPMPDINFSNLLIPEYIFQDFGKYPNKIAVECGVTGKKYTYEELRRASSNFAKALHKKLKMKKGDVVALLLPNVPDFPVTLLGALQAALLVTTINPVYTPDEIKRQLIDSNAKLLITLGVFWPTVETTLKLLPKPDIPVITIKMLSSDSLPQGCINFEELIDTQHNFEILEKFNLDDIAIMPYSSGTTGIPKGVELTSRNIVSNLQQMNDPYLKFGDFTTDTHQDVTPGIIPWFHIYGLVGVLLNNLHILTKVVSLPKFSPDTYISVLENHKPNILYIVPPLVLFMSNNPLVTKKHFDSIHTICSGAAPLGTLDEEKVHNKADKQLSVVQGYGLTESCSCVFVLSPRVKKKLSVTGCVGEPIPNTLVKIVPSDNLVGDALGPNNIGELLVKGPQMALNYHNNPQASNEAYVNGWFRTGDAAYYDDNKLFYIADRLKELIKVKGFQVAPAELEEIIRNYPGVAEVAVIGVPHDAYGEVPRAFVVLKPNINLNMDKLQDHVSSKVSSFKQLKGGVVVLPSIPKTASGKIIRAELKLMHK